MEAVRVKIVYPAIFKKQYGAYTVNFPDLHGCITQGETYIEALENAKEAGEGWIKLAIINGEELPKKSTSRKYMLENFVDYKTEIIYEIFVNDILLDIID